MKDELFLILHDIRSAYNVGAIFRTADGAGISKIYLTGYTPIPTSNEKIKNTRANKMIEKTALGAEKTISWEKYENLADLLRKLKKSASKEKITVAALEKTDYAIEIKKYKANFPLALILGNEVNGVPKDILEKCDIVISIPMRGKKESLNVSVAAGIAMYELLN